LETTVTVKGLTPWLGTGHPLIHPSATFVARGAAEGRGRCIAQALADEDGVEGSRLGTRLHRKPRSRAISRAHDPDAAEPLRVGSALARRRRRFSVETISCALAADARLSVHRALVAAPTAILVVGFEVHLASIPRISVAVCRPGLAHELRL